MFLWNVEKCVSLFKETYVSSDSQEILALAEKAGAIPIERPQYLCGDTPDIPVYVHAIDHIKHTEKVMGLVAVHANNPTVDIGDIKLIKDLVESGYQEVMTCRPTTHGEDYHAQHNKIYGSIRGMSRKRLVEYGDPYKPKPQILIVDNSIEIETQEDFDACLKQLP